MTASSAEQPPSPMPSPASAGSSPSPAAGRSARHAEAFLEMLAAERGASRHTLDAYRRDLDAFCAFSAGQGCDPLAADRTLIGAFLAQQAAAGMSPRTAARRLSALRQFFRFLYGEGVRADDPSLSVDRPKQPRPLPRYLSEDEVDRLFTALAAHEGADGLRLAALLEILYGTGLRVSELVGLPLSAIGRDGATLRVRGKGDKERVVPLTEPALDAIRNYLAVRDRFLPRRSVRAATAASPWLFPSRSGDGHLTRIRFAQLLKALAREAGLPGEAVSPHVLRHSFASHLLAHGADLRSLQQLLGHADIGTTQIYTHLQADRLKRLVEEAHPLARRGGAAGGRTRGGRNGSG